tara:strand:+ start:140 stop:268 length:129 start_codon:yes stop_codon:yes gene_type:complete
LKTAIYKAVFLCLNENSRKIKKPVFKNDLQLRMTILSPIEAS